MRDLNPAERAALDEGIAAAAAGDERGQERAWYRFVVASGRRPQRVRWVVGGATNGHDHRGESS